MHPMNCHCRAKSAPSSDRKRNSIDWNQALACDLNGLNPDVIKLSNSIRARFYKKGSIKVAAIKGEHIIAGTICCHSPHVLHTHTHTHTHSHTLIRPRNRPESAGSTGSIGSVEYNASVINLVWVSAVCRHGKHACHAHTHLHTYTLTHTHTYTHT